MKKAITSLLLLSVLGAVAYRVCAKTLNASTGISIVIPETSGLAVTSGSLIFKDLQPGVEASKTSTVVVTTNAGLAWKLKMFATGNLPVGAVKYSITGPGDGTYTPGQGEFAEIPTAPTDVYVAAPDEIVAHDMSFTLNIAVNIPANVPAGTYSAGLNFQSTTD